MIPILYVINFKIDSLPNAMRRFNCSLNSILLQADKIFILNASKENIDIIDHDKIVYIHKPYNKYFNKSLLMNYMVKHYLKDYDYFCFSDIDLVYPKDYIKRITSHIQNKPVRVIPRNIAMPMEYYSGNYDDLLIIADKFKQHPTGEAHGIGLFHTQSVIDIKGWNEYYLGYAAEDKSINLRLEKYGNKIIFDRSINHIHLWHLPINREYHAQNKFLWNQEQEFIRKGKLIFNDKWGEY